MPSKGSIDIDRLTKYDMKLRIFHSRIYKFKFYLRKVPLGFC